ncbi:hypothetical protein O3P69_012803 [Scylla paramamosain]|uniref:Pre-rRNA-processing protein RIX1 N-terminal domain-containing protein n=1 Tax=Scylla paramamosain TaxID=85552 RepID=A0AAW0TQ20_SCYPA
MDVYQNIWTNCDKTQLERHSQLISECVISQGLFQNEDDRLLKIHVREINCLLNNAKTRERGLRLLLDVVPQCAQQVLAEQCERWFKFCSDAITASRKTKNLTQACQVLTALLRDLPSLPELQRCVSSKSSAILVLELSLAMKDPAPLECLYEYIRAAPGQCLQHKKVLEERMLLHLDNAIAPSGMGNMTQLAGRVFAALPLPGIGGGNVAQARADARGRQLALLLALAHSLMDTLLDGVMEKESHPHPREHSSLNLRPLEDITTDPVSSRLSVIARLSNTLTFVAEMITDTANASITFTADHLLGVAFRLLQVELGVLGRYKSQEHKLLAFFLPSLHHQALLLLRDVITSLGEGTDCYFNALGDLLTSVLQASEARVKGRPVWCSGGQQTKVVGYAVLAELLKASRGRHTPPAALVTLVLRDVSPREEQVKLQRQGKGLASLSVTKAAGKKKGYTVTAGSASANAGPVPRPDRFSRLARVALVVAEMLFAHAAHSMVLKDHQRLQEGVLAVAEVVTGTAHPPSIYSDPGTRVQLFLTLTSLSAAPHPRSPPPFTLLSHLFQTGLSDCDSQVVSACQTALWSLSLIVANPRVELASRVSQQHNQLLRSHEEEEEEETGNTEQQEEKENEKEGDEKEEEEEEEEEPMIEDKISHTHEEEKKEEEETEKDEEEKEEEEGNNKKEDKNEDEIWCIEEEKKNKNNIEKEEKVEEENQKEDNRKKQEDQEEKEERSRRSRSRSMTRKKSQEIQRRTSKEGAEGGRGRTRNKRNGGNNDSPAKRVKGNDDKGSSKEDDGSSEFLTVEEMLKDFVE